MGKGTPLYGDRAPTIGQYVVIIASSLLDNERVLTGTSNQIVVTDNGAGSTVVLSTPQDIHTGASPTFAGATLGGATNRSLFAADGEFTLAGTARVTKDAWIPSSGVRAPGTTKPATWVELGISGAWEFSDATDDTVVANLKFSNDMDMSVAPTISVGWSTPTTVTTETATWQLEYLYTQAGENTAAAAQGTIEVDSNAVAAANGLVVATFTGLDVPNAADVCIHMRLKRLGAGGNDDLTDVAHLHGLCMSYTSNKLGTAT